MREQSIRTYAGDVLPPDAVRIGRDDEISLVDLWLIARRRWLWLLAGLLSGVFVAIAYIALTIPTYESRASIQIGKVPDIGLIGDLGALAVQLIDEYGPESGNGPQRRMPHLKEVTEEFRRNNIMRLVAVGYSPEETRDFLTQIVAKLMQQHEQIYANTIDPLQRRLAALDGQMDLLTAQAAVLGDLVAGLKNSQPAQAALVAIERGRLYVELNQLERDRVDLQQQTTQPYSVPSSVVRQPALPDRPVAPKRSTAVAVGVVLGLALGLLSVFFREFFANAQAASRSRGVSDV